MVQQVCVLFRSAATALETLHLLIDFGLTRYFTHAPAGGGQTVHHCSNAVHRYR